MTIEYSLNEVDDMNIIVCGGDILTSFFSAIPTQWTLTDTELKLPVFWFQQIPPWPVQTFSSF